MEAAATPPAPPQPTPRKLVPIKPAPLPLGSAKSGIGILSSKGNLFQIQGSQVGTSYPGGQLVFAIQNPAVLSKGSRSSSSSSYSSSSSSSSALSVGQLVSSKYCSLALLNSPLCLFSSLLSFPICSPSFCFFVYSRLYIAKYTDSHQ